MRGFFLINSCMVGTKRKVRVSKKPAELGRTLIQLKKDEVLLDRYWRPAAAIVYLVICLFDFLIIPAIIELDVRHKNNAIYELINENSEENKEYALSLIDKTRVVRWVPLTLINGGLFHLSFGAILTGAVLMRGQERKESLRNGKR